MARLDYAKADIKMATHSQFEYDVRTRACAKEPWTVAFIEGMKRGDVLWDVGANVGPYTLLAAALGHDVVAIEPGMANSNALINNANLNRFDGRVYVVQVALGTTMERIAFKQDSTPGYTEGGMLALDCQQVTLDELVFNPQHGLPPPTHIKIDVDGHELSVVSGAKRTLLESASLRALLVEVKLDLGERIADQLDGWGWRRVAIHNMRAGKRIGEIRYEEFVRTRVEQETDPGTSAGETPSAIPVAA